MQDLNSVLNQISQQGDLLKTQQRKDLQDRIFWAICTAIAAAVVMIIFDASIGNRMRAEALSKALQQQEVVQPR